MKKITPAFLSFFLISSLSQARPEYSISFEEFKQRLSNIFDEGQFQGLRNQLPANFDIWGYDVGDFSGDGAPDLALSIRPKNLKEKKVLAYFLISDGGAFIEASKIDVDYFEIPIEVAFTIENGVCFMTSKERNHHWFISGYTFRGGSFLLVDRFEVGRKRLVEGKPAEIGYELYNNYLNLSSSESFFNVSNGKVFLKALYYTFPAYRDSRRILPDLTADVRDTSAKYFLVGKHLWGGWEDLSFSARFSYDDTALNCFVNVTDDELAANAAAPAEGDHVTFWFDLKGSRIRPSLGEAPNFRLQPDEDVFSLVVSPGDFKAQRPRVNLLLRREPSEIQKRGLQQISILAKRKSGGYDLRVRIPFTIFGSERRPENLGLTLEVTDVDLRGGERKKVSLASSQLREWDPSTFGTLRFVSDHTMYGEVRNLSVENLLRRLREVGI